MPGEPATINVSAETRLKLATSAGCAQEVARCDRRCGPSNNGCCVWVEIARLRHDAQSRPLSYLRVRRSRRLRPCARKRCGRAPCRSQDIRQVPGRESRQHLSCERPRANQRTRNGVVKRFCCLLEESTARVPKISEGRSRGGTQPEQARLGAASATADARDEVRALHSRPWCTRHAISADERKQSGRICSRGQDGSDVPSLPNDGGGVRAGGSGAGVGSIIARTL